MTNAQTERSTSQASLRLWPGVVLVALQWVAMFVLPVVAPAAGAVGAMVTLASVPLFLLWWAFFSRAGRLERWCGALLMVATLFATRPLLHPSLAGAGMGVMYFLYAAPVLCLAVLLWAAASQGWSPPARRLAGVLTVVVACGAWALVRTGGVTGDGDWDWDWRWAPSAEERLLAAGADPVATVAASPADTREAGPEPDAEIALVQPAPASAIESAIEPVTEPVTESATEPVTEAAIEPPPVWPGFRGPGRDGKVRGVRIATDWSTTPPDELWRRKVGPGWSSFAVRGDLLYTQEQRGEEEVVSCYRTSTGEPIWRHADPVRFYESNAGAGPRATPTVAGDRVVTLGATGVLNVLDAETGAVIWTRDATSDTGGRVPDWGFSSSPLVLDDVVIVQAGALAAYGLATGELRWVGASHGSYSSPHLITIDDVEQVVLLNGGGATGVAIADGIQLWEHAWPGGIVQPALTADGDLLLAGNGMTGGTGIRRLTVTRAAGAGTQAELRGTGGWTTEERWTSNRLKPNFSDFVVHGGHAFGFDGRILACIDLETGERRWKGGRYGSGQLVLLPDQDLLVVISEKGELALVEASPDQFTELARMPAIEGKTWNHPALVDDLLLVRNGEEMAAFRLDLAGP